ncbi:MAG: hypothetical protein IPL73_18940 [Candidatus Obscuribacter sp.]|jgi:hypothetical protein|nr:hypothetical protein [Candidatus Obscuribacter sp.]MBK9204471.1 hypothetical protein [Candidatus Obscuribacter sp.]
MNNNKRTIAFKSQTPWSKLSPQTIAMGEFVMQQLSFVTGLTGTALIEHLATKSGVHSSYIELFFGRVYMPTPYLLTSIICGAGLELWLLAKPLSDESIDLADNPYAAQSGEESSYRVWVKNESDSKAAFKRLLTLIYGEMPNMVTLSRLSQVRVSGVARGESIKVERMKGVSATKLQAFWYGHESLSWLQLENLLAAARLVPTLCIKTASPRKPAADEDYSYLLW